MTIFFDGRYRIVNKPSKQFYHAAIAEFNKRVCILNLFTTAKKPEPIKFDVFGLYCKDLPSIIPQLSELGIDDFFLDYRSCKGISTTGLLPAFSVPSNYRLKSSPVINDVYRYLGMSLAQVKRVEDIGFIFDKPTFSGEFDRDSASLVVSKMKPSAAVDLPLVNTMVFECEEVCGYVHYGKNPKAEMLDFMEFDIDNGFINRHSDPISKIVSAELQKFFVSWKKNNYQGKPIPDSAALTLVAPAQAALTSQAGSKNPFALMPQPQRSSALDSKAVSNHPFFRQ